MSTLNTSHQLLSKNVHSAQGITFYDCLLLELGATEDAQVQVKRCNTAKSIGSQSETTVSQQSRMQELYFLIVLAQLVRTR